MISARTQSFVYFSQCYSNLHTLNPFIFNILVVVSLLSNIFYQGKYIIIDVKSSLL